MKRFGKTDKKDKDREKSYGTDWMESSVQGGSVVLALVKEASQYAPVPGLQQAAGAALQIVRTVQAVKDNKVAFQRLATDSTNLIAAVWRSYQASSNKKDWPPQELKEVITDLVTTLNDISKFVQDQLSRSRTIRLVFSNADVTKITEYRERLQAAVAKFEVSSHLNINDVLQQVLKKQIEITEHLATKGIVVELTDVEKILAKTSSSRDVEGPFANAEYARGTSSNSRSEDVQFRDIPRSMGEPVRIDTPRSIEIVRAPEVDHAPLDDDDVNSMPRPRHTKEQLRASPEPMAPFSRPGDRSFGDDLDRVNAESSNAAYPYPPQERSRTINEYSIGSMVEEDMSPPEDEEDIEATNRYLERERQFFSKRNDSPIDNANPAVEKSQANYPKPSKKPTRGFTGIRNQRATVESDEETAVDENEPSERDEEEVEAEARLAAIRDAKKKKPRASTSPSIAPISEEEKARASLARMTLLSTSQSPPPGASGPANPGPPSNPPHASPPYPPAPYPPSPYPPYYQGPPYGGGFAQSPPMHAYSPQGQPHYPQMMGSYPAPHYGYPGMYGGAPPITSINSGNTSSITITNSGNNHSRKTVKARPKRRPEEA